MNRLKQLILAPGDPREVRRVKLRTRSWLLLNVGVVGLPAILRVIGHLFVTNGFWPPLHLEEVLFFSLFTAASALVHLTEFTQDPLTEVDEALYWQTWAAWISVLFLVFLYGIAFSGSNSLSPSRVAWLVVFTVIGVVIALNGQLLIVDYTLARSLEGGS